MMFHMSMSMCIVLVGALVFVVGGFEEDRATRGPGKRPDGISRCMPAGPRSHGACVGHGTSDIEIRVVSRLTVKRGYPRASDGFVGDIGKSASVLQKARHIVCASCVYKCKLIVQVDCPLCRLIVQVGCASWLYHVRVDAMNAWLHLVCVCLHSSLQWWGHA